MHQKRSGPSVKILYEDDCYTVFDKPAGLLVIPTPKKETRTLIHIANQPGPHRPASCQIYPCHRIDRETSGVIIFAKGKKNQRLLMNQFREQKVRKVYVAIIQGTPPALQGEIKSAIRDLDQRKFNKHSYAKVAITRYKVRRRRGKLCVLDVYPLTGRTNQIRIHLSKIGCPILGDRKYAVGRDFVRKFRRTALHAYKIQWNHPVYHRAMENIAPLPEDMKNIIDGI